MPTEGLNDNDRLDNGIPTAGMNTETAQASAEAVQTAGKATQTAHTPAEAAQVLAEDVQVSGKTDHAAEKTVHVPVETVRASAEDILKWYKTINAVFEKYGIGRAAWSYKKMDFGISDEHLSGVCEELIKYL